MIIEALVPMNVTTKEAPGPIEGIVQATLAPS